jgi:large subunit ribosomal protein L29
MKKENIQGLSEIELKERINVETESLQRLKFGHAITPVENPSKINKARKVVARLKTELRSKQLSK